MDLLKALHDLLEGSAAYRAARARTYIAGLPAGVDLPCTMLAQMSGTDGFTHDGPHGLNGDLIRVYTYAESASDVSALAKAAHVMLQGYQGQVNGLSIQLIQHQNRTSDYGEYADAYQQVDSYRVRYTGR